MTQAAGQFYYVATPTVIYRINSIYPNPLYEGGVMSFYNVSADTGVTEFMSMHDFKQAIDNGSIKSI
jgi:hypothetical protein